MAHSSTFMEESTAIVSLAVNAATAALVLMGAGMTINLGLQWLLAPGMAPGGALTFISIAPLVLSAVGQSMITPSAQLLMMDLFPNNRGMVSSAQGFTQVMLSTLVAGIIAPLVSATALQLAIATAAFCAAGICVWLVYLKRGQRQA